MKRALLVTLLAVVESLFGVAALCLGIYLFKLSFATGLNVAEIRGDRLAAAIFGVFGAVWIVLALLVFVGSRWGWWLGSALNLVAGIVLISDIVGDWRHSDASDIGMTATFVVLAIVYLLPPVRNFRRPKAAEITRSETTNPASA